MVRFMTDVTGSIIGIASTISLDVWKLMLIQRQKIWTDVKLYVEGSMLFLAVTIVALFEVDRFICTVFNYGWILYEQMSCFETYCNA